MPSLMSLASTRGRWLLTLLTFVFLYSGVVNSSTHPHRPTQRILPELQSLRSDGSIDAIIQFNQGPIDMFNHKVCARGGSGVGTARSPIVISDPIAGQIPTVYYAVAVWGTLKGPSIAAVGGTSLSINRIVAISDSGSTGGSSPVGATTPV